MAMDSKIVEYSVKPVRSQFGLDYITSYKSNLGKLKIEVQNLEATKNSVQKSVDEAKRNGEKIVDNVQIWLKKVDAIISEGKKLIDNNDVHAKDKYCMRCFQNLWSRHQQNKKSKKTMQDIHEVLARGNFDKISKPSTLKEIQLVLKDPEIYMIGLYGIDGVGKTTLAKELAWQVEKDGSFDVVVMAEVTDSLDVENIQGQIANALCLNFEEKTKEGRAEQLRQRINKQKNMLIVLDDICRVDLAELGIPYGDDHMGCKLLLTTKNLNLLKRQMGTQKDFRLEVLSDDDSWKLFKNIAGDVVEKNYITLIAQDVVEFCDGLPLFIVVIAKALRNKDVSTWMDALNQ